MTTFFVSFSPRTSTSTSSIISRVDEKHCLFSLIRDIICSNPDHRMTMEEMKTHVHVWAQSPTYQQPPYNSWESLLPAAVGFLAGEIPGKIVESSKKKEIFH